MAQRTNFCLIGIYAAMFAMCAFARVVEAQEIVIDASPAHVANSFSPVRALGAGVDRLRAGEGAPQMDRRDITKEKVERNTDQLLSGPVLAAILSAGWQPVTYRQKTELQMEAWHWNPKGTWSNAAKSDGYFTGSAEPTETIRYSWAYPLPRRGDTVGDGDGWSRLTDGDPNSYWKSNSYLGLLRMRAITKCSPGRVNWSRSTRGPLRAHGKLLARDPSRMEKAEQQR